MASTNHTTNYNLPQWEGTDAFCRADFNDAFEKIDTAIAGATLKIAKGEYVGNAPLGNDTYTQFINLGFTPKAVLILRQGEMCTDGNYYYGGLIVTGAGTIRTHELTTGGFTAIQRASNYIYGNEDGVKYTYFAIG